MPNICDSLMCRKFVKMLEHCEALPAYAVSAFESQFIADMRIKFEERDTMIDLGLTPWNPSVNQWNTLQTIYVEHNGK